MRKILVMSLAAVAAVVVTGCRWCSDVLPNDPSCAKSSHDLVPFNEPATTAMVTPTVAISREVFRPVFRAGAGRLTVVGSGNDREDATYDAIAKFLDKTNCDYIVSVSTVSVKTVHPKPWWYLFVPRNRNYRVTLSGIPVYLEKLSVETLDPDKVDAYDAKSGVFLPSRGYFRNPKQAVRRTPPLPPVEMKPVSIKMPVLTDVVAPGQNAAGSSSSSSLLPSLKILK